MTRRWTAWLLGVAVLVGVPVAWHHRPVPDRELSAEQVLDVVRAAADRPYSGQVETTGTLQLPSVDGFSDLAGLVGETTRLRVWWRGEDSWRVDRLLVSGEQDLVHDGRSTTTWDYEDAEARTSRDPSVRLPRTADLLPPELAARALAGEVEATRVDPRRVAGIDAVGVRLEPAGGGSTRGSSIDHVLLWADPDSGLPLEVEVYGEAATPSFTSRFVDVDVTTPPATTTAFDPPASADVSFEDTLDIADAANQYAPLRPPATVAGLEKAEASDRAVGVYGTGLAQAIAIPLRDDDADALREQLRRLPGARVEDVAGPSGSTTVGTVVSIDLLGVALTGGDGDGGYLVAGTVTDDVLVASMSDLLRFTRYVGDDG